MSDRTVHARCRGFDIVRYDRAGKWWLEPNDGSNWGAPSRVPLTKAALIAYESCAFVHYGRPGGRSFDAAVRKLRST